MPLNRNMIPRSYFRFLVLVICPGLYRHIVRNINDYIKGIPGWYVFRSMERSKVPVSLAPDIQQQHWRLARIKWPAFSRTPKEEPSKGWQALMKAALLSGRAVIDWKVNWCQGKLRHTQSWGFVSYFCSVYVEFACSVCHEGFPCSQKACL